MEFDDAPECGIIGEQRLAASTNRCRGLECICEGQIVASAEVCCLIRGTIIERDKCCIGAVGNLIDVFLAQGKGLKPVWNNQTFGQGQGEVMPAT